MNRSTCLLAVLAVLPAAVAWSQVTPPDRRAPGDVQVSACGDTEAANPGSSAASGSVSLSRGTTGCTITFRKAFAYAHCTVSSPTGATITSYTDPVTTQLDIRTTRDAGNTLVWKCS